MVLVLLNIKGQLLAVLAGLVLALLLGWLSYRYVEIPTRKGLSSKSMISSLVSLSFGMLLVGVGSALVLNNDGFPSRVSPQANAIFDEAKNKNPRLGACAAQASKIGSGDNPVPNCTYGDAGEVGAVIVGDSHSSSLVTSLKAAMGRVDVLQWTANACPLAVGIYSKNETHRCPDFLAWVLKRSKELPSNVPIVLANRFSLYLNGPNEVDPPLEKLVFQFTSEDGDIKSVGYSNRMRDGIIKAVCELAENRDVYIVKPIPELGFNVPASMGRSMIIDVPTRVSVTMKQYVKRNEFALATLDLAVEQCGVKILDPIPYLCDKDNCWGDANGLPIYFDDDHLNERGSEILVPMFRAVVSQK